MPSASTASCMRERIHDGGEHAHVIAGDAVHAGARQPGAAEDVAAADHDRDLHPQAHDLAHLERDALEHLRVDAVVLLAHERFARQLEQDAAQSGGWRCRLLAQRLLLVAMKGPGCG